MSTDFHYHCWHVWLNPNRGIWQAKHTKTKEYVNFSEMPDVSVENVKRILDDPRLIAEQQQRVQTCLSLLEARISAGFAAMKLNRMVGRMKHS